MVTDRSRISLAGSVGTGLPCCIRRHTILYGEAARELPWSIARAVSANASLDAKDSNILSLKLYPGAQSLRTTVFSVFCCFV